MPSFIRLFLAVCFLFATHSTAWSEDVPAPAASAAPAGPSSEIMFLIDQGLNRNLEQIQTRSGQLSDSERFHIYTNKKKEPLLGFLLNFLIGLGIGSFAIGDSEGGMTELIGELVSGTVGSLGSGMAAVTVRSSPVVSLPFALLGLAGFVSLIVFRVGGWLRPFAYTQDYNSRLGRALGLPGEQALQPDAASQSSWTEPLVSLGFSF